MEIGIVKYGMNMHMSMDKFHTASYSGTIVAPGHNMDGRTFRRNTKTYKPFGPNNKCEQEFSIDGEKEVFSKFSLFLKHYGFELKKQEVKK